MTLFEKLRNAARGSTCPRARCAAIAITDEDIPHEVTGYNHHVGDEECVLENDHCVSAIHAEIDMIANAARCGISLDGADVMSLERPCQRCLIAMKAAGIRSVMYVNDYHSKAHGNEFVSSTLMEELNVKQSSHAILPEGSR